MSIMKKWFIYATVLSCLSLVLVACSDKEEAKPAENIPELTPEILEQEEVVVAAVEDEELYQKVVSQLEETGFTVSEPAEAAMDMFRAESGMTVTINGDALLPLHLYKLDPSDKRLEIVEDTGNLPVYIGSKTEQLGVIKVDHFVMYLHKGHPDYEEIVKVLDNI
ncbi:hypothetical protein CSV71_03170 [Sporosarcina sp. P21c]|uniref:hypothetical protein n=1 Tax=Sporosarcina TaxID=1569 RepID=UPI000A16620E|nr:MULTISPECIES: hypothetical protein [Sporosarcina]ARJ37958.1 hypothetical protein SporoP8_03050 [Sporosarcina ureae]PIC67728.1 hypothetical protein CSV78_05260 [Sporosarcina sp. P16a]PIC83721.1 hypothetical protein CSV73_05130 [Sporosarcina sp. P1]PIC90587.1 hypothetical protein CSV71_03170 [Sporosarcina sp. P21c]PIC93353.1 hypothetical protein CSV70_05125 [Sporosarcina sp. P25]